MADAVGRVVRVDGQIGGAGLEDGEQRDDEFGGARYRHGNGPLRPDALGDETPGQAVGAGVEFGVGEGGVLEDEGRRVRGAGRLLGEKAGQGGVGHLVAGVVAADEEFVPLDGTEDVDPADGAVRVGGDRLQQPDVPGDELLDRGPVEQVGAVLDDAVEPVVAAVGAALLAQLQREVETGRAGPHRAGCDAQAGKLQGGPFGVLQREHHLEQRVPGEGALGVDDLHEPVEGDVLVGVGGEVRLADPGQQLAEGRVAGGVAAQHQVVDEEADEVVEGFVRAARDGGADGDVLAAAEPVEQGREARLEDHEEAAAAVAGQLDELAVQLRGEREGHDVAPQARLRGARTVRGQRQFLGQTGQDLLPVGDLTRADAVLVVLAAEEFVLPEAVVGVLHRQRLPRGGRAGPAGGVGGREVAGERRERPAVAGDVVQQEQQDVPPRAEGEEGDPQRRLGRQVERKGRGLGEPVVEVVVGDGDGTERSGRGRGQDDLVGAAVGLGEDGAQALVPGDDVGQGVTQGIPVQFAVELQHERDVVAGTGGVEAAEEPQAPLGEGERDLGRPRPGLQGRAAVRGPLEEGGEPGRGGRLEEAAQRQFDVERGPHAADQAGGLEGVAAELEEAVVHPDGREAEDLGEQTAEDLLLRGARGAAGTADRLLGRGQRLAVELAVGGEREFAEHDERRRHHVLGERGGQPVAQRPGIDRRALDVAGDGVGDEPLVAGPVLADQHDRLGDVRVRHQHRLDLAELDPEAAQLHLVVGAAQVLQGAVLGGPHQVAGAVHPGTRTTVGAGGEPLRGQRRTAQVAAGQLLAREVELSHHARGDRAQRRVQHEDAGPVHGPADGRDTRTRDQRFADRGHDGGFGGAVGVDHAAAGGPSGPPGRRRWRRRPRSGW